MERGTPVYDASPSAGGPSAEGVLPRATSIGVDSAARSAYDCGYHVALVVDAMTDREADAHCHRVEKIFPRLGEAATTDDVLTLLQGRPAR